MNSLADLNEYLFGVLDALTNGLPGGIEAGTPSKQFPADVGKFIREHIVGLSNSELAKLVNETFGASYEAKQISAYKKNHGLHSGLDGRFKKGHPHNKGKKGQCSPGCEKGWFKKGNTPHNHLEVGAEVMTTDGYLVVKTAEPNVWEFKHIPVWGAANGPVPEGHAIVFLDRDHTNTNLENISLVSLAELLELNRRKLLKADAELTATGILIARVNCKISKIKNAKKEANTKCRKSRKPSRAPSASISETRSESLR